jgi:hypothetical protein
MNPDKYTIDVDKMKKDLFDLVFSDKTISKLLRGYSLEDEIDKPQTSRRSSIVEGYLKEKGVDCDV